MCPEEVDNKTVLQYIISNKIITYAAVGIIIKTRKRVGTAIEATSVPDMNSARVVN